MNKNKATVAGAAIGLTAGIIIKRVGIAALGGAIGISAWPLTLLLFASIGRNIGDHLNNNKEKLQ